MAALEKGFGLEELRVDPQSGEVSGPGGREELDRKVMDVLLYMARHAGHVVAREDLLADALAGRRRHRRRPDPLLLRAAPPPEPRRGRRSLQGAGRDAPETRLSTQRNGRSAGTRPRYSSVCGEKTNADMGGCDGGSDSPGGHRLTARHAIPTLPDRRCLERAIELDRSLAIPRHERREGPGLPCLWRYGGNTRSPDKIREPGRHRPVLPPFLSRTSRSTYPRSASG